MTKATLGRTLLGGLGALLLGSGVLAADPAIEETIRKVFSEVLNGNRQGVTALCHPEIAKFRGTFDTGYTSGRSGSLGELAMLAMAVADKEKVLITNLKVEVVKEEGDRAIAWATYHAVHEYPSELESSKGQMMKYEWDARDYIILKKHNGQWRLRRLEDRAGHFLPLEQQHPTGDPWGGVA